MFIKSAAPSGHVVSLTAAAWGHAKGAIALLSKIVRYRPVYVTMFVATSQEEKAKKEFDAQFLPKVEDDMRKLITVIPLQNSPNPFDSTLLIENFIKEYRHLIDHGRVHNDDVPTNGIEPGPPQLVILDFFLYDALRSIRDVSGSSIPIYTLQSGSVAACLFLFGPEKLGGLGDLDAKLKSIPYTDEDAIKQEAERIFRRLNGELIEIPGIPPMYDHEHVPQKPTLPLGSGLMVAKSHKFFMESDGAIMNTTKLFEGKTIEAFQEWFGEKPVISVGPFDFSLFERQATVSATGMEVEAFLDTAMEKHGPNSVIYFSFGSIFWPQEPEKYWAILDIMIDRGVPFIVAHASPFSNVPDDVKEKVKASGLGYMSEWLPQTAILSHNACGWFVTHCGHNSVTEAISAGVPLICWPFAADQPTNAANVTVVHNIGYELFEVRTGDGIRPIHRLGGRTPECSVESAKREFKEVLEKAGGEDGKIKRANMKELHEKVSKQWAPGGENWQELKKISDILQG